MLLGRRAECLRIDELLEAARSGRGGALVVRGSAGIGKSALLAYAEDHAVGVRVVSATGIEGESEFAYGALHELLRPLLGRLDAIPPPQAAALEGALALGPAVPGDRFAVAAGVLSLLAAAAEDEPLLVLIDDAHWLDDASAAALSFALRRLRADPVAVLVAVREGEPSAFESGGFAQLPLRGLDEAAATTLLERHAPGIAASVSARLIDETEGNPLALIEVPGALSDAQLAGLELLPPRLPPGDRIARAFVRRLDLLPAATRRALLLAASSSGPPTLEEIAGDLDPAEQAGLVSTAMGTFSWRHPLVRAAVYHAATGSERRAAHRRLAATSRNRSERAWHLAAAATGADEHTAALLEDAASEARSRGGYEAAAEALARAAALSSDAELRARRLLQAGRDLNLAGRADRARTHLDAALATTHDALLRADINAARGELELWAGDAGAAHGLLVEAAREVEHLDPARALPLLVGATIASQMTGRVPPTMALARTADELAETLGSPLRASTRGILLNTRILAGDARRAGPELLELARDLLAHSAGSVIGAATTAGHGLTWIGKHDEARTFFSADIAAGRTAGAAGLLAYPLACRSEVEFRAGSWKLAHTDAAESVRLAEETGRRNVLAFSLVSLARIEAATGRDEDAIAHVASATSLAESLGAPSLMVYAYSALGLLELGAGRIDEALADLERVRSLVDTMELREPAVVQWRDDYIEALILAGRAEDARRALAVLEAEAEQTGGLWAGAVCARCRGMLAEDFEPEFATALATMPAGAMPFEEARTNLRLGERRRRAAQAVAARPPLQQALDTFEWLGAVHWAARAEHELAATGAGRSRTSPAASVQLTTQELRIALLIAEGATNREAAAALFISPKTVGYHLARIYEKLGINRRAQLAAFVTRSASPPAVSSARARVTSISTALYLLGLSSDAWGAQSIVDSLVC